jgi:phospho-N-acetylmuramoyl-pentapeptide-transferase
MPHDPNENMAVSLALAAMSFAVTLLIGRPMVTYLRQRRFGKKIRDELTQHVGKTGTPTMGGLMFTCSAVFVTLIFNVPGRLSMLLPVGVLIAVGFLGYVDDRMNLVGGKQSGMTARFKFAWLWVVGIVAATFLYLPDPFGLGLHSVYVPFFGQFDMKFWYVPVAAFAIVSMANAVNLTDGLDGLAALTAAIAFCAYGIIAYRQGQLGVVTFCFTMVGSLSGFLWFNAHPAQVIMGDTGALPLGAALAVAAFMTGQWLLLPIVGAVFIAETLSVMIQVSYFKLTKGKRVFLMTPFHHHFEVLGWSETQITIRFALAGMMCGLLGVALALL